MLTKLKIKPGYTSPKDNVIESFYVPCMKLSKRYSRVAGYFSSSALKHLTEGIESLIRNGARYQLIISNQISEYDYNQILEGYKKKDLFKDNINQVIEELTNGNTIDQKRLANLAYLIEIGLIEIKIGFIHSGLFHAKYGIFTDADGNQIYFNGSNNETENAIINNFETFDTKKSWASAENKVYINSLQSDFDSLWLGDNSNGVIYVKEVNEYMKYKTSKYSRGRIIVDKEIFEHNKLVLVYNGELQLVNNLENSVLPRSRYIDRIKKDYVIEESLWKFKSDLSYRDIEKIISNFKRFENREGIEVLVARSVNDYIENSKFEIDEIASRGLLIKSQDVGLQESVNEFGKIVDKEFADDFSLRGIQEWVSFYMTTMKRVANFSVPGSGKTAMVYGAYAYLSSQGKNQIDRLVVIGPKNSFLAWKEEYAKIFGSKRTLKVLDVHSQGFQETMFIKNVKDYNLILVNYEALNRYGSYLEKLVNEKTMIVFDEVHKTKLIDSTRSNISIRIANKASYRYVLTGTPIPNSFLDIWNFLHILYKDEYDDYFDLSQSLLANPNPVDIVEINSKLSPFFWRVTKADLDVPKPNEDFIMTLEANELEQAIIELLWRKYSSMPLKLYVRLIQMSSNPQLLLRNITKSMFSDIETTDDEKLENLTFEFDNEMIDVVSDSFSPNEIELISRLKTTSKFEECIRTIDSLCKEDKTVLVWCIFVDTIEKVKNRLSYLGYSVAVINGQVKADVREEIIKDFQNGKYDVLVTNPHTLAESVSLHKACHDAIYLEYSFNLTHMLQSRDRIHRLGLAEDEETSYYYFMLEGRTGKRSTIDNLVYERLKEKEERMLDAIERNELDAFFNSDEKEEIFNMMIDEMRR